MMHQTPVVHQEVSRTFNCCRRSRINIFVVGAQLSCLIGEICHTRTTTYVQNATDPRDRSVNASQLFQVSLEEIENTRNLLDHFPRTR